ncbi:MAG: DUF853 domain-containing protein [Clostridia bacterium]|nr:DUF853 domain-containing protein [Clostridia bacterium]
MVEGNKIYMGLADDEARSRVYMQLGQSNRHGLIAGASGTGKTITMKVMAESFSAAGVPVFLCDVKGDVSGICEPGADNAGMQKRIDKFGIRDTFQFRGYPTVFYDIYGRGGHPVRTTVSDAGPALLARMMGLTDVQEGVLNTVFRIADDKGLKILDLKDLRAVINFVSEHRNDYTISYGNMAPQSLGAITRALIPLEEQGGNTFFGEPALDILDWIRTAPDGRGYINVLHCVETIRYPKLYAMFLLWMMAELFEVLPEVGDPDKPRLVFFFDEAHMLFRDMPKALTDKIEQTVKLIRSKGVGIYFVTQSPSDIPDSVLAQLSNRVQHALRAYTPAEQKAVRAAAQSFRANPAFKTEDVIMSLGTGEALTSFLDEKGIPTIVQKTSIICPESLMAPAPEATKQTCMNSSPVFGKYDTAVDNESAYEVLEKQSQEDAERKALEAERKALEEERAKFEKEKEEAAKKAEKEAEKQRAAEEKAKEKKKAEAQKKKDRRNAKIESQLISAGGSILKRGLLGILKFK